MRTYWGRASAITGLLAAIFSDLRRRTWWAYRAGSHHTFRPTTTIVARRPAAHSTYVPVVTENWRSVVTKALPIGTVERSIRETGEIVPVVWIDVAGRPDIADLPRVLRSGREAGDGPALVGTQWLADQATYRTVLAVTVVEPVAASWALSFDLPRCRAILAQIANASEFFVAWNMSPLGASGEGEVERATAGLPLHGLLLTVDRPAQLRAILTMWADRLGVS